jgi:hypothetical protein
MRLSMMRGAIRRTCPAWIVCASRQTGADEAFAPAKSTSKTSPEKSLENKRITGLFQSEIRALPDGV